MGRSRKSQTATAPTTRKAAMKQRSKSVVEATPLKRPRMKVSARRVTRTDHTHIYQDVYDEALPQSKSSFSDQDLLNIAEQSFEDLHDRLDHCIEQLRDL
ncbi:hypothetical protein RCL1_006900 [Eukaryota sp. TZLM3-RCL]